MPSQQDIPIDVIPTDTAGQSPRQTAADNRNFARVATANEKNERVLGKYISDNINDIMPPPIQGPNDAFDPGDDFLQRLTEVANSPILRPSNSTPPPQHWWRTTR
jgi:hypothetical protein